ncbi:hypothetical protein KFE25_013615 [Diacronema lutheri]|uniref:3'(2'),5'-bisphosphate nucleotidase n=3 Tax=Diacronema lutheri TaxID=2081491 RepID=A0A8J6CBB1_DIALT|nr:hypothetical protein KFE25_013615 [Diacronema lutheri]
MAALLVIGAAAAARIPLSTRARAVLRPHARSHIAAIADGELQYGREAAAAIALVDRAVRLCLELSAEMQTVASDAPGVEMTSEQLASTKGLSSLKAGDNTPVTAADFAIQAFISSALAKFFPDDAFMGEEDSADLRADASLRALTQRLCGLAEPDMLAAIDRGVQPLPAGKRFWVLDPIDGTKGFLTGAQYIVGLALVDGVSGQPLVAAMGNPRLHPEPSIMVAAAGAGMRMFVHSGAGVPAKPVNYELRLNGWSERKYPAEPSDAPGIAGEDYPPWLVSRPMSEGSPLPFGARSPPGDVCCGALCKYWSVAAGTHAGFIQFVTSLKTWDHVAGVLCVVESGGRATDAVGAPVAFLGREVPVAGGVVCSAREAPDAIHERMTSSVRSARGAAPPEMP